MTDGDIEAVIGEIGQRCADDQLQVDLRTRVLK
jgi:hypothetical protein